MRRGVVGKQEGSRGGTEKEEHGNIRGQEGERREKEGGIVGCSLFWFTLSVGSLLICLSNKE